MANALRAPHGMALVAQRFDSIATACHLFVGGMAPITTNILQSPRNNFIGFGREFGQTLHQRFTA